MKTTKIIRNKHIFKIWFINLVRNLVAKPENIATVHEQVSENPEKYFANLFKVGAIKPRPKLTTSSKFFEAHISGLKLVTEQIGRFTKKYPELVKFELIDPRWARFVIDWADVLANQAAAACNTQSDDDGGPFDDPTRCVDAWLAYNDAVIELGMAQADLDDCLFQNSNPPITETPDDEGPFGPTIEIDPCMNQAWNVVLAENNVNAAWDDIRVWC